MPASGLHRLRLKLAAAFKKLYLIQHPDHTARISLKQKLPLLVFAAVLAWYMAQPSGVAVMALVMLGGLLLGGYLWARAMAWFLRGERSLRYTAVQVGDELEELVTLRNASWLPALFAEFIDHSSIPGYTVTAVRAAGGLVTTSWRAHTICTLRGVFTLGPWELVTGDPFGLFQVKQVYPQPSEILVYPPLAALPPHLLPHIHSMGDQRPLQQPLAAETIDASATRLYQPGDPLRRLHWPTTARREAPYVKTFQPEVTSTVWLAPDFDVTAEVGQGANSSTETMVTLAASLAAQFLKDHLAVGLFAWGENQVIVPPQRGVGHLWDILRALAPLHPAAGRPFARTLEQASLLAHGRDLLIAITPSIDPAWLSGLRRVSTRGRAINVQALLIDPASFISASAAPAAARRPIETASAGRKAPMEPRPQTAAEAFAALLTDLGIAARVLRADDVKPTGGAYGDLKRWDFKTLGTGRVVVRQAPRQAAAIAAAAQRTNRQEGA